MVATWKLKKRQKKNGLFWAELGYFGGWGLVCHLGLYQFSSTLTIFCRGRKDMIDNAFESWGSVLLHEKTLVQKKSKSQACIVK